MIRQCQISVRQARETFDFLKFGLVLDFDIRFFIFGVSFYLADVFPC